MNDTRTRAFGLLAGGLAGLSYGVAASDIQDGVLLGVWRNPKNSVHLELHECGDRICGRVVWANDKAKADAREGGTDPLVGTELLRGLERTSNNRWRGTVYVPDIRREVTGTIVLVDSNTFRARSCALSVFCKTQVWMRLPTPSP